MEHGVKSVSKFAGVLALAGSLAFTAASHSQKAGGPMTIVSHVDIKPDYALPHASERSAAILRAERAATKQDQGLIAYELLQETESPNHFTIVETWADAKAQATHEGSEHTVKFRNEIQPLLGGPFDSRVHMQFP
jgi:quinol monooxygenase YgiN